MRVAVMCSLGDEPVEAAVRGVLADRGVEVRFHDLTHERFAPCRGCFQCWVEHPGTCRAKDHANDLMRDVITSDAAIWLVRHRFGVWDPIAKAALDKTIGLISPFFTTVGGETHHRKRYERFPGFAALAVAHSDDTGADRDRFRTLVARNVLNMRGRTPFVALTEELVPDEFATMMDRALTHFSSELPEVDGPFIEPLPPLPDAVGPVDGERRAVLWVGSARSPGTSTSEALGTALMRRLQVKGWDCRTIRSSRVTKFDRAGSPELVEAAQTASVLIAASPVYIDCLPALVLRGLADLVEGVGKGEAAAMLPIVQCGFPEATHTRLAVELLASAASQAGMPWAGHLAFGAGGVISGSDIDSSQRFRSLQVALDRVADALTAGQPVPQDVTEELSGPLLSPTAYRLLGNVGWLRQASSEGTLRDLWQRPFEEGEAGKTEPVSV